MAKVHIVKSLSVRDLSSDKFLGAFDDVSFKNFVTALKKKYGKKLQVRKDPDGWLIETGKYVNDPRYDVTSVPFNPKVGD